ncbi:hypothetical protein LOTGIDRAFT_229577 [Lottia gigantea]|uniref:Uncharacterized protein n=1 Tax=Lottia gigantea TaxID=225164 RepID=V4B6B8_LOTGI|nr:hypothetical protein LOTGIDRAFT_229577 [Lottia gigantea]ESO84059.1 hypothetical protein LOTGIDRAFT_229577 [Lottia gigantea]
MMMATPPKVHDPLYNFETHFPEKFSRLHLHGESSGSFKRTKRKPRTASRYKTQPITFDEIQEVDEPPPAEEQKTPADNLKTFHQPFSRSIDGLLPKVLGPRVESGLSKEAPACVMKRMSPLRLPGSGSFKAKSPIPELEERLKGEDSVSPSSEKSPGFKQEKSPTTLSPGNTTSPQKSPTPSPNMAPRRQKVTAKAKKRQKADGKDREAT